MKSKIIKLFEEVQRIPYKVCKFDKSEIDQSILYGDCRHKSELLYSLLTKEGYEVKKLKDPITDELFKAVLKLESIEECYNFFEDICTVSEIKAIAQRLEVAIMLKNGEKYSEIKKKTGASSATISRVNRALNYGADGYNLIIERIFKEKDNG